MTRENKVALVVGFALVLFVGILVSDHLSKAQTQRSANFVPASSQRDSVDRRAARLTDLAATDARAARPAPRPEPAPSIPEVGEPRDPLPSPLTDPLPSLGALPQPEPALFRTHEVRSGESLSAVAHRYYGDVGLTEALAEYNGITDPDMLWAGRKLKVPAAGDLTGNPAASEPPPLTAAATPPPETAGETAPHGTYRVRVGDSLSTIAQRFLSSAGQWRRLYELNRDVISDPDEVRAGTLLKVPSG